MGNFSTNSFPSNRWTDSDSGADLDTAFASIDAAIRHAFGFSVNALVAPFDIADDGSIVVQTSIAIGTSNAMIDVVDSIPASPGANENQKLAHVTAIRGFLDMQTIDADNVLIDTSYFFDVLGPLDSDLQHAMNTLDDHSHDVEDLSNVNVTIIESGQVLVWENGEWANQYPSVGEGVVYDHGLLSGLSDNDHEQYFLTTPLATSEPADVDLVNGEAAFWYAVV